MLWLQHEFSSSVPKEIYSEESREYGYWCLFPLTPKSDQDRISHYNINIISSRQMMRIKKNIN